MSLGLRLLLMPVFAFGFLAVAIWLDTSGTWPLGFWAGQTQDDAGFHSIVGFLTLCVFWMIGTAGGQKRVAVMDPGTLYGLTACGGCARRREIIAAYVAPVRKTNWWAAAGCFSLLGIILLIAHAIHS